jgi:hypothetical protein
MQVKKIKNNGKISYKDIDYIDESDYIHLKINALTRYIIHKKFGIQLIIKFIQ